MTKLELNALQTSKDVVIKDYLLTQEFFSKCDEQQMNRTSHVESHVHGSHFWCYSQIEYIQKFLKIKDMCKMFIIL